MFHDFTSSNLSSRNSRTQESNQNPEVGRHDLFNLQHSFNTWNITQKSKFFLAACGIGIQLRQVKYGPQILYSNNKLEMSSAYPKVIPYVWAGGGEQVAWLVCVSISVTPQALEFHPSPRNNTERCPRLFTGPLYTLY